MTSLKRCLGRGGESGRLAVCFESVFELISTLTVFHMDSFLGIPRGTKYSASHCSAHQNRRDGCFSLTELFLYLENTRARKHS